VCIKGFPVLQEIETSSAVHFRPREDEAQDYRSTFTRYITMHIAILQSVTTSYFVPHSILMQSIY